MWDMHLSILLTRYLFLTSTLNLTKKDGKSLTVPRYLVRFNLWFLLYHSYFIQVCKITYARIQGKSAFIEHFRNSSLMNEEVKCRPLIFYGSGPQQGLPEPFPDPRSITPRYIFSFS